MPLTPRRRFLILSALILCGLIPAVVMAQADINQTDMQNTDILPVKSAAESGIAVDENNPTDPAINLTPDKSMLVRLGAKASTVLVGNPAHLNILPEGADTLVLVPRAPGATYFTVLDENNKVLMQRHVIISGPEEKYVRIRKPCNGTSGCQPTQVYYCPDMCHEIILDKGESSSGGGETAPSAGSETATGDASEKAGDNTGSTASSAAVKEGTTEE